ncbi:MAG: PQQ-binding-like beta-propeller repeat protein [Holophagales bacterium]|nr:PQQ-binding-like beta-propeller repeat protein [Holophagales bacterium]
MKPRRPRGRRSGRRPAVWCILPVLFAAQAASGADWPNWRGPARNGYSEHTGLPLEWSHDGNVERNVLWKLALPDRSGSTPIVVGDVVFLNVAEGDDLSLWRVDAGSGDLVWQRTIGGGNRFQRKHNMSSPSPITDGERVWVLTGTGALQAYDFDGNQLWARELEQDYGAFGLNHGYGSSALLWREVLYVPVLHGMKTDDPSYLLAIDSSSGETIWRQERPTDARMESPDAYITPALVEVGDGHVLVLNGGDVATGHDPESGRELWRVEGFNPRDSPMYRVVASPVSVGDLVFVPTRVNPMKALRLRAGGEPELLWETDRGPDVPTPATDGKTLYLLRDNGLLSRLDARTGAPDWQNQRLEPGTYSASLLVADGKVYATSEDGVTTVVRDGPEFEILAKNQVQGFTLSSLGVAAGRLYLRTDSFLYCIVEP